MFLKGSADHSLFKSVLQNIAPTGQKLQRFGRPIAASGHTHTCVCFRLSQFKVASQNHGSQESGRHAVTMQKCDAEYKSMQGGLKGSSVTKVGPTSCCCEHTDV